MDQLKSCLCPKFLSRGLKKSIKQTCVPGQNNSVAAEKMARIFFNVRKEF